MYTTKDTWLLPLPPSFQWFQRSMFCRFVIAENRITCTINLSNNTQKSVDIFIKRSLKRYKYSVNHIYKFFKKNLIVLFLHSWYPPILQRSIEMQWFILESTNRMNWLWVTRLTKMTLTRGMLHCTAHSYIHLVQTGRPDRMLENTDIQRLGLVI